MEDLRDSAAATGARSLGRALFCTPVIPNAAGTGARQRAFTALRALQNRYAIHVLLVALTEEPAAEELAALRAPFSIATLDPPDWPPAALRKVPLATLLWESVLGDASSRDLQRLRIVPALDPAVPYDLTFYFRTRTAKFHDQLKRLAKVGGARVVYDMDDVESTVMERAVAMDAKRYGFEQRLRMRLGAKRLRRLERRLVRTSDVTFVCSEVDRQRLSSKLPGAKIEVVPNAVHIDNALPRGNRASRTTLLFLGLMSYAPNADAAVFFCREILPTIRKGAAGPVDFLIVGPEPAREVRALSDIPGVQVTGRVADVEPVYMQCHHVVVPIRYGGGTRIKILEALALGRSVVSTSVGAEGLNLRHEMEIMVADTPVDFAHCCLRLMREEGLARRLAEKGRRRVLSEYAQPIVASRIERLVESAAS